MAENGGEEPAEQARPSRLRDYLDPPPATPEPTPGATADRAGRAGHEARGEAGGEAAELPAPPQQNGPRPQQLPPLPTQNDPEPSEVARHRREFAAVLGEFRRTPVLLPLAEGDVPLVADLGGIRWIYAFSNEDALARFATARGETRRAWPYRRVLGARLLDVGTVVAGVPCGVALDVGSEGDGVLFPPVTGIVPDEAAVDRETDGEGRR